MKSLGLKQHLTSEASGIVQDWKQDPGLPAPLVWSSRAIPVFLESVQKAFGVNLAQPSVSIDLAMAEQLQKPRDLGWASVHDSDVKQSPLQFSEDWREFQKEEKKSCLVFCCKQEQTLGTRSGKY